MATGINNKKLHTNIINKLGHGLNRWQNVEIDWKVVVKVNDMNTLVDS